MRRGVWLVLPLLIFMLVFYAAPLAAMLSRAVLDPGLTMAHFQTLSHDAVFAKVLVTTLRTAAIVTAGTLLLGYPVALTLSRLSGTAARIVLMVVLLPFWTSVLVRSYAWMVLLGRKGLINESLLASGLIETPLKLLNTPLAVDIAMIHILLPYMILPVASVLGQIDPSLPRAAASLGAPPFIIFLRVIFPLSVPGIAAGTLLVFVLSLGFYITPALVGGPRDMMLSMLIAQQIELLNWPYAACLSAALLGFTLLMIGLARLMLGAGGLTRAMAR